MTMKTWIQTEMSEIWIWTKIWIQTEKNTYETEGVFYNLLETI